MRKRAVVPAAFSAILCAQPALAAPTLHVCRAAYSDLERRALYQVDIDWNGMTGSQFQRIDIGVVDTGGIVWPQVRTEDIQVEAGTTRRRVTIGDVTRYPVQLRLLGFTAEAARSFDQSCENGFCSLPGSTPGVTQLGEGASISSVQQAPPCG